MYNIYYKQKALDSLKTFIDSYKNSFIKLIQDSGLEVEDQLINSYIEIGNNLYKNIIDKLEYSLFQDAVLGRCGKQHQNEYIVINVNNFRLFVYYNDKKLLKNRIIEDIEFFRK